jgi:predicted ATPase/DNA-binding SARP family transcriptional activator/Tfp pilus assembly protein PilF
MNEPTMQQPLQLKLFGFPQIIYRGQVPTKFDSDKVRALLIYLAIKASPQSRKHLAELLWEDTPATMRRNLCKAISNLSKLLGNLLVKEGNDLIALDMQRCWVDVHEFDQLYQQATLHEATQLYQADFLNHFHIDSCEDFEQWAVGEQARLRLQMLDLLHKVARHHEKHNRLDEAIQTIRRLLTIEPWCEEAHRWLMELLMRAGQRSAALAQFELCQRVLQEELAVPPSPETVTLAEQIRQAPAGRSAVGTLEAANPRNNLPTSLTPLIGRRQEIAEIAAVMTNHRLVTLTGVGGCGKTRLALALAEQFVPQFGDGACFVSLAPVTDPAVIPTAIAEAAGLSLQGTLGADRQLVDYLRFKKMLLVVDNVEHLIPKVQLFSHLLQQAPGIQMLATSRQPLHLYGEQTYTLLGLPTPPITASLALNTPEVVQIFVQGAQRTMPAFRPQQQDLAEICQICRLVDGLPLGIELAATWVRHLSCAEINSELQRDLGSLVNPHVDVPERHRSLDAVIQYSWDLLAPKEKAALRALSVFRGGCDRQAALQVAKTDLNTLAQLVDKSLLNRADDGRYGMHEVVRQFAHEQLLSAEQATEVQRRHVAYYLTLAQRADDEILGAAQFEWVTKLSVEKDNLRAALTWCQRQPGEVTQGLRLTGALLWFWFLSNSWHEGQQWAETFLQHSSPTEEAEARAMALFVAGGLCAAVDEYALGSQYLQASLALLQPLTGHRRIPQVMSILGIISLYQNDLVQAAEWFNRSLALIGTDGNQADYLWSLQHLGETMLAKGDFDQAYATFQRCLHLNQQIGYTISFPQTLIGLARVERSLGDWENAKAHLAESLRMAQELDIFRFQSMALSNLGWIALQQQDAGLAQEHFYASLQLYRKLGDTMGIADAIEGLAVVAATQNDGKSAAHLFGVADGLRQRIGVPIPLESQVMVSKAVAELKQRLTPEHFSPLWSNGRNAALEKVLDRLLAAT